MQKCTICQNSENKSLGTESLMGLPGFVLTNDLGYWRKGVRKNNSETEDGKECFDIVSSGQDTALVIMNSY